jgi:hypothetical protein
MNTPSSLLKSLLFILILVGLIFALTCEEQGMVPDGSGGCMPPGGAVIPGDTPGGSTPGGTGSISVDSSKISGALLGLCQTVKSLLGVAMMLMVVSAAIVYSLGQVMGAETRARASVWATSMFNGAIIAALIYLIVPWVLNQMLLNSGVTVTC